MKGWRECKLGDAPLEIIDGDRGKNYPTQNEFKDSGYCLFLSTKNVRSEGFEFSECQFISEEKDRLLRNGRLQRNDVVLTTRGTVGNIGYYDKTVKYEKIRINSGMVIIRPDQKYLLPDFNYYLFRKLQKDFHIYTSGSAQPQLPIKDLVEIPILLPPLPEQKAIAAVLSSLDDKIDFLQRQNKTLEAMAETLFRQWFVEPCKNGLPEGWREAPLSELCLTITKGTTPTTLGYSFTETGVNFLKAESLTDTGDFSWDKFAKISDYTHKFLNRSILSIGDVLCSIAGTIGRVAIVNEDILPANTNQAIAIIRPDLKMVSSEFVYLFLRSGIFREIMDGKIVHAVQPNLSLSEIGNTKVNMPPFYLLNLFQEIISTLFNKKTKNYRQIRTLEKLRDTLLPKLMSGEVRVEV
jgi:type I restriction enzyme S subunit